MSRRVLLVVEGCQRSGDGRAMRRGFLDLLARSFGPEFGSLALDVVMGGPRSETFNRWARLTRDHRDAVVLLLVDAEAPVSGSAVTHLTSLDGWRLAAGDEGRCHLMVQLMETWIVADGEALQGHYGAGFLPGKLPRRRNLEDEPKERVLRALAEATARTQVSRYHKTAHAPELLARLNPAAVAARCPHFVRLRDTLLALAAEPN